MLYDATQVINILGVRIFTHRLFYEGYYSHFAVYLMLTYLYLILII